jgi:hypothetical protein
MTIISLYISIWIHGTYLNTHAKNTSIGDFARNIQAVVLTNLLN